MQSPILLPLRLAASHPLQLCVVVDTEEEFDWHAPYSRNSVSVTAIDEVGRLQEVMARYGAKPTYVIDYPVAATASSARRLADLAQRGLCQIGAHLHPWVSPPYTEAVSRHNSYACNLTPELEREKIEQLSDTIVRNLAVKPRSYKAGRYGFAASTAATLESLGFDVDVSINPRMNFRSDGGPNFEDRDAQLGTFGRSRRLLEVPCSTGFIGLARNVGVPVHRAASASWLAPARPHGLLSRLGVLNRVMLSPEGNTLDEMKALTRALLQDGVRVFSLTFHSPSLKPGCTPYVRTEADRDGLLRTIDQFCQFFMGQLGGVPSTPTDVFDQLREASAI